MSHEKSMEKNRRYVRNNVHWGNLIALISTLAITVIVLPVFLWYNGAQLNWWLHGGLFVGFYIFSGMGITFGYHRLFAHFSFKVRGPVKLAALLGGATAMQDSAINWVSDHRRHHKHVDHEEDPYNIKKGFWHAHVGWIMFKPKIDPPMDNVKDLAADPMVMWQHRWWLLSGILIGFGIPTLAGYFYDGGLIGALGGFLIGGVARLVAMHHGTFFINSLCHYIGKQPYSSTNTSKDSWITAIFTFGEGYHNFHHEFQHDYRNGVKPWQFDPTKWVTWTLAKLGLASDLRRVPNEKIDLAEIGEKNRKIESRLSDQSQPVCEKAQALFAEAGEKLQAAAAAWETAKREHTKSAQKKLELTKEQLAELRLQFEAAVTELREAIQQWHAAHQQLAVQLA
jgi:stearoyl-CoA desaturase (delta-9 desaturase)